MTSSFLLPAVLLLWFSSLLGAFASDSLAITEARFDAEDRFRIQADIPAGNRHAVLEAWVPSVSDKWRPMLSTELDGRAAKVSFKLPRPAGAPTVLARVTVGTSLTVPAAELTDPSLSLVTYVANLPTEKQKIELLKAAGAKLRSWKDFSRAERQQRLVAWAESQPFVTKASIVETQDSVSLELVDDDVLIVMNRPKPTAEQLDKDFPAGSILPAPLPEAAARMSSRAVAPFKGVPDSNRAVCAFSLETSFPNSAPTVAGWLSSKGYQTQTLSSTTVEQVKNWFSNGPLGVLFWHAHGAPYKYKDQTLYSISLNQAAYEELSNGTYFMMRQSGALKLAIDDVMPAPVYAITRVFIRDYMSFSPHSLVVLDACNGAHVELAKAFEDVQAGAYASWNKESGPQSIVTLERLFDRLLGMNARAPISVPGERPFALPVIRTWMDRRGYDFDPTFNGERRALLKWHMHPTVPAHILRPSIKAIEYEGATTTRYRLVGDFGKDPGPGNRSVIWGTRELQVMSWDQDQGILVDPLALPLPVGNFEVRIRDRHLSNLTPMTEWTVPFHYKVSGKGSLQYTIAATIKMRADVHGYRELPEAPITRPLAPHQNHADLTGTISASGTYVEGQNPFQVTYGWTGSNPLRSYDLGGNGLQVNALICNGMIDTATGLSASFGITCSGRITQTVEGYPVEISAGYDINTMMMMRPKFVPNQGWALVGGEYFGNPATTMDKAVSSFMGWPTTLPAAPPTATTVH